MRVIYIHHPHFHLVHAAYAKSVGADFLAQDFYYSYSNIKKRHRLKKYISWLLLFIKFPYKKYDVILTDEPQVYACILKLLSFGRLKLVATQASISLNRYFNNAMPKIGAAAFKQSYNYYNLVIAIGDIQYELAKKILRKGSKAKIEKSFNGVSDKYLQLRKTVQYSATSKNIIAVVFFSSLEIYNIKGVDIMIETFIEFKKEHTEYQFFIIGNYNSTLNAEIEVKYNLKRHGIFFVPFTPNLDQYYNDAICAFHLSRMDAWPLAVTESLFVGVPVFISDKVGAKAIYEGYKHSEIFICNTEEKELMLKKINSFIDLSPEEKEVISNECKTITENFTEQNAIVKYKQLFDSVINVSG